MQECSKRRFRAVNSQRQHWRRGGLADGLVPPATVPAKRSMQTIYQKLKKHEPSRMPSSPSLSILSLGHPALLHHQTVISPTSPVPHPHILPSLAARSWQLLYSLVSSCGHHYPGVMTTIRAALHFPHSATLCCIVLICCTKCSLIHRIELGEQTCLDHEISDSHQCLQL